MVALAATRNRRYIIAQYFPPDYQCHSTQQEFWTDFRRAQEAFARSGDHGTAAIPKPVPTLKVQRRFTV